MKRLSTASALATFVVCVTLLGASAGASSADTNQTYAQWQQQNGQVQRGGGSRDGGSGYQARRYQGEGRGTASDRNAYRNDRAGQGDRGSSWGDTGRGSSWGGDRERHNGGRRYRAWGASGAGRGDRNDCRDGGDRCRDGR